MPFVVLTQTLNAGKEKTRNENGEAILCVEGSPAHIKSEPHKFCLDAATHELASDEWQEVPYGRWERHYSNFFEFEGQKYPREQDLLINGKTVISANLAMITAVPFDPALLEAPKGAVARRKCPGMKPPLELKAIEAEPGGVGNAGPMTATVTILADGSVGDVRLASKDGPVQNKTVLEQIKGLRFRPAMCGDTPIVVDVTVAVP